MNLKLTRRQFGQIALASTAVTAFNYFTNKSFAQVPSQIVGLSLSPILNITEAIIQQPIVIQSIDLESQQVQSLSYPQVLLPSDKFVSGFTCWRQPATSTLVVAITPISSSDKGDGATELVFLNTSASTLTITGLNKGNAITSLLGTSDGKLLALVTQKNGRSPTNLAEVNPQTGELSFFDQIEFPQDQQIGNLVECGQGTLYITASSNNGNTYLVRLDLGTASLSVQAQLSADQKNWNNGLQSLICSPSGQLLAFGAPRYVSPNRVYILAPDSGVLSSPKPFGAIKIAVS